MSINTPRRDINKSPLDDLIDLCKEIGWNIATIFWLWDNDKGWRDRGNWPDMSWAGVPVNKPRPTSPMSWHNSIPLPTKKED